MRATRLLAALAGLGLLCAGLPARSALSASLAKDGDLIAFFEGGISPTALPRSRPAPIGVKVLGGIRSASGQDESLPQLRTIRVAINRRGVLFYRGLPVCDVAEIQPATERTARRICGDSIVGSGHVAVQVHISGQPPFPVEAPLLAFNGPRRHGQKLILAQAYSKQPPGAFVITFKVTRRHGLFGTVMSTTLPPSAREWAYLTHFEMNLRRVYSYGGARRSFVSAACPAPSAFHSAIFPLARATYGFADGRRLTTSETGRCTVKGS